MAQVVTLDDQEQFFGPCPLLNGREGLDKNTRQGSTISWHQLRTATEQIRQFHDATYRCSTFFGIPTAISLWEHSQGRRVPKSDP